MTYSMGYVDTYRIVDEETMGMIDVKWNDMHFIFYRGFFGMAYISEEGDVFVPLLDEKDFCHVTRVENWEDEFPAG